MKSGKQDDAGRILPANVNAHAAAAALALFWLLEPLRSSHKACSGLIVMSAFETDNGQEQGAYFEHKVIGAKCPEARNHPNCTFQP